MCVTYVLGAADIVDDKFAHQVPTEEQKGAWRNVQDAERMKELAQKEEAVHAAAEEKASTKEAIARRLEREQRRAASKVTSPGERMAEPSMDAFDSVSGPSLPRQTKSLAASSSTTVHSVRIPTSSSEFAWYSPAEYCYSTIDAAREAGVWSYPETSAQRARCCVFRVLWEKGYYMGCGIKFGGDFLVYPGEYGLP